MTHRAATERHFLSRLDDPDLRKPGELARDYAAESSIIRCLPEPVPGYLAGVVASRKAAHDIGHPGELRFNRL